MTTKDGEFLGELRFGRRLTSWVGVAAGGFAILAGFLLLLPPRLLLLGGLRPGVAAVLAGVVLGLTLTSVFELLGGTGERGGTYVLTYEIFGGVLGLLTGWALLGGSLALTAAFLRTAARHLLLVAPASEVTPGTVAIGLLVVLVVMHAFERVPRRHLLLPATILVFLALGITVVGTWPRVSAEMYGAPREENLYGILDAIAWVAAGYMLVEAPLVSRQRIRTPNRLLPPALLAIGFAIVVGLLTVTVTLGGLDVTIGSPETGVATALGAVGVVPRLMVFLLAAGAVLLAADESLMTAGRQLHTLSTTGMLPPQIRRVIAPFAMPPLLLGLLTAFIVPLLVAVPIGWMIENSAALFLVAMTLLNVAAIYSRQMEPERRRVYELPFHPLVPAVAIVVNLVLLFAMLSGDNLLGAGIWLAAGSLLYYVYSRDRQLEAQEGLRVFGRKKQPDRDEDAYRVLLPIQQDQEQQHVLRLAGAIATQRNVELLPLQVIRVSDPLAVEEGQRIARERNALFKWSTRMGADIGVPTFPITRLAPTLDEGILDTAAEDDCDLILMPWRIDEEASEDVTFGDTLRQIVYRAPCDLAILAYRPGHGLLQTSETSDEEETAVTLDRILVPTAGGPHAPLAGRLAVSLARKHDAVITVLTVVDPDATAEEREAAERHIADTIAALQEGNGDDTTYADVTIERCIVEADDVVSGISEAGSSHDLVLVGASEQRVIADVLFGTLPEQVAMQSVAPVVIVQRYRGLRHVWLRRFWATLADILPQLDGEAQIEAYRQLRRDARPDVDFFIMIGLSTIIATFGLLQNSSAVIIGAMLVAPLFSPILGISMGIIRGDVRMAQLSFESTLKGVVLAIGLAAAFTLLSPLQTTTSEMLGRTTPNLFDLGIALASGAAGAYATARREMSAALPGVAIAAALIPPLGVVGVGLAIADVSIAGGSALLFVTNLTAIVLAGALIFLLVGFRPGRSEEREALLRRGLIVAGLLLLLISVPLATIFVNSISTSRQQNIVQQIIQEMPGVQLATNADDITIEQIGNDLEIKVTVYADDNLTESDVRAINRRLSDEFGGPVDVSFTVIPIEVIRGTE